MFEAMRAKDMNVEYYIYQDEGHSLVRAPNLVDFMSRADRFLATHMGGRFEDLPHVEGSCVRLMHENMVTSSSSSSGSSSSMLTTTASNSSRSS